VPRRALFWLEAKVMENKSKMQNFKKGIKMGIPIGLGYFAVSLSLGLVAKEAGMSVFQASLMSFLVSASAGEYAAFSLIAVGASYIEVAIMEFVANIRYLLMSCALSQKISENTSIPKRMLIGFAVTDEMFSSAIIQPDKISPIFYYGMMTIAVPMWTLGTGVGVVLGNILPSVVVDALGVSLYGMFLASIIPAARSNKVILGCVAVSMVMSFAFTVLPYICEISSGLQTIIITVAVSSLAALMFPVGEAEDNA